MNDRYKFPALQSIKEGKRRMRQLIQGLRDIDRQLGDRSIQRPDRWRAKAITSKMYKQAEYDFLKEEVTEMRQAHAAREAGIYAPDDPRHLLLRLRQEISQHINNETNNLGHVLGVVDHYLEHDGGNLDGRKSSRLPPVSE